MMTFAEAARDELEKDLQEKLGTYVRLVEVSKRVIEREELQIANYEAKIGVLRESLSSVHSPHAQEAK